jgi:hypothetical protein
MRTAQRIRAMDFIGFSEKVSYTPTSIERGGAGKLREKAVLNYFA